MINEDYCNKQLNDPSFPMMRFLFNISFCLVSISWTPVSHTMGNQSGETETTLKQRNIPKLVPSNKEVDKDTTTSEPKKVETEEERIARINQTKITVSDFLFKCLDHEMLKLFFLSMIAFFLVVGFITCIYLTVIFFFKQSLWQFYFPTEEQIKRMRGEL